jgi:hypothetical protein
MSRALLDDMTPDDLKARTKKFAVDVIRFAKAIPKDHINDEIASQLADAATSTAAHIEQSVAPSLEPTSSTSSVVQLRKSTSLLCGSRFSRRHESVRALIPSRFGRGR